MIDILVLVGVCASLALQIAAFARLGAMREELDELQENAAAQSEALAAAVKRLPRTRSRKGSEAAADGS